jgi:hypothetical protein
MATGMVGEWSGKNASKRASGIEQFETKAEYQTILECGCSKVIGQSVTRTPSGLEALRQSKDKAARFQAEHQKIGPIDPEIMEIRSTMESDGLL